MFCEYRALDLDDYRMDMCNPHRELEPLAQEIAVVEGALERLREAGVLPHTRYDRDRMLAFRRAVRDAFEIPWTAITPRMQRLLYAINAIARPRTMIAAGVFCGYTFICNAGAAVGPGACYAAADLVGVEIKPHEAERARRNVQAVDPTGIARIVAADAVRFAASYPRPIDLLYLDADGAGGRGKSVYLDILHAAWERLAPRALVLAHNSVNAAGQLKDYLACVRDPARMCASVNVAIDGEGLEVSLRGPWPARAGD